MKIKSLSTVLYSGLAMFTVTASLHAGSVVNASSLNSTVMTTTGNYKSFQYSSLPPNTWIRIHQPEHSNWRRQTHAGAAYDTKRGTLLLFGSNTHGRDWDNSVHEFDPRNLRWETHYPQAPRETYRMDLNGFAIAGTDQLLPWAMHTFDGVVYDPVRDALVVMATPSHNPVKKKMKDVRHATWLYDLDRKKWKILATDNQQPVRFFNAASAYDSNRKAVVACKKGLWSLAPESDTWDRLTGESHHNGHHTMEYDSKHAVLAVFGSSRLVNDVWGYTAGDDERSVAGWTGNTPGGDVCSRDQHLPVAFDESQGVFLLVVDNNTLTLNKWGKYAKPVASTSSSFVYDYGTNRYTRLPDADMPALGMNYMMVYARQQGVFLLVTGNWKEPPVVWALRLDMARLKND